jgi:membrane protein implicated in regulation of membrane protease activity
MGKSPNKGLIYLHWKRKDSITVFTIISLGLVMTSIGFLFPNFYSLYISLCLGFFIGGLLLSFISTFLAQMESNITGAGEIDAEVDVDIDAEVDVDIDAEVDVDIDAEVDVDIDAEVDVDIDAEMDIEMEGEYDSDVISTITPAPIMLLFSTAFLVYGISGLSIYFLIRADLRFIVFFAAPVISFLSIKLINSLWKILAKSRYYRISSTMNLIGKQGEVILKVDDRGGVIKVPSKTPLRFERLHVKPVIEESIFERGDRVYICAVKNGYLLVDNSKRSIKKRRR